MAVEIQMPKTSSYDGDTYEAICLDDHYSWRDCEQELWDRYQVIFLGVHAIKVIKRDKSPLFVLGSEDDGTIRFYKHEHHIPNDIYRFKDAFDSSWGNELIQLLQKALEKAKEYKNV